MAVESNPYDTNWRAQAAARTRIHPDQGQSLYGWVISASFRAAGMANAGEGAQAAEVSRAIQQVLLQATPLELIDLAIERAEHLRPPRRDSGGDAKAGRYASLAITALEEARNWERCRSEVVA